MNSIRASRSPSIAAQTLQSFYLGLQMSLAGMLESPQFLFRQEVAEPDPNHPGTYRLDAYSKASQLELFPVERGTRRQTDGGGAARQARHAGRVWPTRWTGCCNSPRLEAGVRAFFTDMLQFDLFDTLAKDAKIYPKWTVKVAQDAQEQTLRSIVDLVLTQHGDYRDLFTTRKTFLTPLLGSVYGVPVAPGRRRRTAALRISRRGSARWAACAGEFRRAAFARGIELPDAARQGAARAAAVRTGPGAAGKCQFRRRPGHSQSEFQDHARRGSRRIARIPPVPAVTS